MSISQEGDAFEELIVDHAKAAQIKEQGNSIHEIFNVVIEYGDLIKTYIHPADIKQSISIYGDLQNRTCAKNYIMAIASPQKTESISISELLSNKIKQSAHFKSSMIRQYQCSIKIVREPVLKLVVQGAAPKVAELVASIKKELNEMSPAPDASSKASAGACMMSTLTGHLDKEKEEEDDDDVIWIRDPYEMFNDPATSKRGKAKPAEAGSPAVTPKNTATTALAINKTACEDLDHLKGVARKQGFTDDEIEAVVKDIHKGLVRPADLLDYLHLGRKTKSSQLKSSQQPKSESAMDCGAVTPKPSSTHSSSNRHPSTTSAEPDDPNLKKLQEYAAMLSKSNLSQEDRMSRLSMLISAMPDDQKMVALSKVSNYNALWGNNNNNGNNNGNHLSNKEDSSSGSGEDDSGDLGTSPGKSVAAVGAAANSAKKTKKRKKKKPKAVPDNLTPNGPVTLHSPRRFGMKAFTTDDIASHTTNHVSFQVKPTATKPTAGGGAGQAAAVARSPPKSHNQMPNSRIQPSPNSAFKNNRSRSINSRLNNNNSNNNQPNLLRPIDLTRPPPSLPVNINHAHSASTSAMNGQLPMLRHIVIDGSNIAREHGKGFGNTKAFSARGIKIAVDYFRARGHDRITAMLPRFRRGTTDIHCPTTNPEILDELENQGFLAYTPSRQVNNKMQIPYDDRLILTTALHYNAVVVSNDNYRDLARERDDWRIHIERNLLQYTFVGDLFMVAEDPFGRQGPTLDQLLSNRPTSHSQPNFGNQNHQQRANHSQHFAMPNFNQFHSQKQKPQGQDNGQFRKKSNTFSNGPLTAADPALLTNHFAALNTDAASQAASVSPSLGSPGRQVNQGPGRRPRNQVETWELYEQLREIFPDQLSEINSMLSRYPHEMDSSVLITRLLGLM